MTQGDTRSRCGHRLGQQWRWITTVRVPPPSFPRLLNQCRFGWPCRSCYHCAGSEPFGPTGKHRITLTSASRFGPPGKTPTRNPAQSQADRMTTADAAPRCRRRQYGSARNHSCMANWRERGTGLQTVPKPLKPLSRNNCSSSRLPQAHRHATIGSRFPPTSAQYRPTTACTATAN